MSTVWRMAGMVMAMALIASMAVAETVTWNNSGDDWFNDSNWDGGGQPGDGDDAIIPSGTVVLTNLTANLASLTMNGGSLTFSNWTTRLTATTVTLNAGATVTHSVNGDSAAPWEAEARVWIACSNLTVASGAQIDAEGKGYTVGLTQSSNGRGPGGGGGYSSGGGGAGHGGFGGGGYENPVGGLVYGSVSAPESPGSGGGWSNQDGGNGGGAVRIDADGTVIVDGVITCDGKKAPWVGGGGGSGGSIFITCHVLQGTDGAITAKGGMCGSGGGKNGNGGGGRIAVIYASSAQQGVSVPDIRFGVESGLRGIGNVGDVGSLYFPDGHFLSVSTPTCSGAWYAPGFTEWSMPTVTLSNVWLRFPADGFTLTVANDLAICGVTGRLDIGGNVTWTNQALKLERDYNRYVFSDSDALLSVSCGSLSLEDGGRMWLYAARTNATTEAYGAKLAVAGDMTLGPDTGLYLQSNPTNGGSAYMTMSSMTVSTGALINADCGGFAGGVTGHNAGYGYGGGGLRCGGSYGGQGGDYNSGAAAAYGSSNAPALPGSGGGKGGSQESPGGAGGGLVWIEAARNVTLNGTITADGGDIKAWEYSPGGGSGGGIYVTCKDFTGGSEGVLRANGGDDDPNSNGGAGGGGRVALWWSGTCSTSALFRAEAVAGSGYYVGEDGTVVMAYRYIAPVGTVISIR